MKIKPYFFITLLLFISTLHLTAQPKTRVTKSSEAKPSNSNKKDQQHSNFIKINLTGIILKNYTLQYERSQTKKISFALAFRSMPSTTIPFKNLIIRSVGNNDTDTKETIKKFRLRNFAFTPEIRFYLNKKGYGHGFYIAPFYRYANFETNNMVFTYENSLNVKSTISISGKLTGNTGGILFGVQKYLGKHLCLDWWFFGPHYGSSTGNFNGISSNPLTPDEQDDLKKQLNDLDIPFTNKTVIVTANGASIKLDGPWAGLRTGISLGVKF